jgi:hypothetical protein
MLPHSAKVCRSFIICNIVLKLISMVSFVIYIGPTVINEGENERTIPSGSTPPSLDPSVASSTTVRRSTIVIQSKANRQGADDNIDKQDMTPSQVDQHSMRSSTTNTDRDETKDPHSNDVNDVPPHPSSATLPEGKRKQQDVTVMVGDLHATSRAHDISNHTNNVETKVTFDVMHVSPLVSPPINFSYVGVLCCWF